MWKETIQNTEKIMFLDVLFLHWSLFYLEFCLENASENVERTTKKNVENGNKKL